MTTMSPGDAARILAVAAAFDRRTVGETDAIAWADALTDLDPRECADAVRQHYRESDRWIMPSHIRDIIATRRRDQARAARDANVIREIGATAAAAQADEERRAEARAAARRAFHDAVARSPVVAAEQQHAGHLSASRPPGDPSPDLSRPDASGDLSSVTPKENR